MKNRISIGPRSDSPDQRPPVVETAQSMFSDPVGEGPDSDGLWEAWRAWATSTSSVLLNRVLFTSHGTSGPAILEDWISFQDGSSELDLRARDILGTRMKQFRANPAMPIVISGLAGRPGAIADGMRLGLRRILSIRTFLRAHGIESGRIGIAVRGSGWSVTERSGGSGDLTSPGSECRLHITDAFGTLARN